MSRYQLIIELLSDMCVSDGGVYNSSLDTDICHDTYGFPYIPARRIKGCLRECGLELREWGMDIQIDKLFGEKGADTNRAKVRIGNAYLEDYAEKLDEVKRYKENLIFHPQNVLNHFSYVRTQTAVDYETGVAQKNSLRTMRVVNKGNKFIADVNVDDEYYEVFKACCDTFTNIGIARTRGLGEIKTELTGTTEKPEANAFEDAHASYVEGAVRLDYELSLEEPLICKSINGGETRSLDYIDGGKILGLIANELKKQGEDFISFMNSDDDLFCSNAYLAVDGIRYLEVPANYYSIKNDHDNYVEKGNLNSLPEELKDKQLNMMKHCYVLTDDKGLHREDVKMEERYHHRRPEDKSIGRAVGDESGDSKFYQISSIEAGQKFSGYVTGTAKQIHTVYSCLSKLHEIRLGYSHSSEYGKVKIKITDLKCKAPENKEELKNFMVKLESPAIVYNKNAFYSTNIKDLDDEIQTALSLKDLPAVNIEIDRFVNYTTVGGYNVTWNMRKPTVEAFDKGTVLIYHLKEHVSLNMSKQYLIGERVSEGFGEISIKGIEDEIKPRTFSKERVGTDEHNPVHADEGSFAYAICEDLFRDFVKISAANDVKKLSAENERITTANAKSTISNMITMCKENNDIYGIEKVTEERYGKNSKNKAEKLQIADDIIEKTKSYSKDLEEKFCKQYNIKEFKYSQDKAYLYLEEFLQQLKYCIRTNENKGNKEGE